MTPWGHKGVANKLKTSFMQNLSALPKITFPLFSSILSFFSSYKASITFERNHWGNDKENSQAIHSWDCWAVGWTHYQVSKVLLHGHLPENYKPLHTGDHGVESLCIFYLKTKKVYLFCIYVFHHPLAKVNPPSNRHNFSLSGFKTYHNTKYTRESSNCSWKMQIMKKSWMISNLLHKKMCLISIFLWTSWRTFVLIHFS